MVPTEVVLERQDVEGNRNRVRVAGCHCWTEEEQEKQVKRNKNVHIVSNVIADPDPTIWLHTVCHVQSWLACVTVCVVEEDGRISWKCRSERCQVLLWVKWLMRGWERPASRHLPNDKQKERESEQASECSCLNPRILETWRCWCMCDKVRSRETKITLCLHSCLFGGASAHTPVMPLLLCELITTPAALSCRIEWRQVAR